MEILTLRDVEVNNDEIESLKKSLRETDNVRMVLPYLSVR